LIELCWPECNTIYHWLCYQYWWFLSQLERNCSTNKIINNLCGKNYKL